MIHTTIITKQQMQALFAHLPLLSKHEQGQRATVSAWSHLNVKEGMSLLTLDEVAKTAEIQLEVELEMTGKIPTYVMDLHTLFLEADDGGDKFRPSPMEVGDGE